MHDTWPRLRQHDFPAITRYGVEILQMNLGYLCNIACLHCHVGAGPTRTELMPRDTMEEALAYAAEQAVHTLDLTGGSPEMNPDFRWLVTAARRAGLHVIDRCNPTLIEAEGYDWVAPFLAEHGVEVIASLPCYLEENVDSQRGDGVFLASIRALQKLNALGYGRGGTELELNLVYNPVGSHLPPAQSALESDYRTMLGERYGIVFNKLYTLTNMPIKRFGSTLISRGQWDDYLALLRNAFVAGNLDHVMCRRLLSVDYQGYVYDCDFNQMLGLPLGGGARKVHLRELRQRDLHAQPIAVAGHCFGCTAGQGSSCGGALT